MANKAMQSDPLAALHDIHLPIEPSWWPPAPGWWLLLLLLLVMLVLWWRKKHSKQDIQVSKQQRLQQALQELAALQANPRDNTAATLAAISALLKRFAISTLQDGQTSPASLSGQAWLAWLDAQWSRQDFSDGEGRLLADAVYQAVDDIEITPIFVLAKQWLEAQQ